MRLKPDPATLIEDWNQYMTGINIESLLKKVTPDAPSGESDLSSSPEFIDLEIQIEGTPEREFGGQIVQEARDPDWRKVQKAAMALSTRTHDLRVVLHLVRSLLHTDGFDGLAAGLALLYGLIDRYWDSLYPRLDPDDNYDPIQRINILAALSEGNDILAPLKKIELCNSKRLGKFCFRDVLIAGGKIVATKKDKTPPSNMVEIEAAFKDTGIEAAAAKQAAIQMALKYLSRLKNALNHKIGDSHSGSIPDFKALSETLTEMDAVMKKQLKGRKQERSSKPDSPATINEADHAQSAGAGTAPMDNPANEINNRQDVIHLLDKICNYYESFEPGSPVPLLLKRARQLVEKNFIEIIQDLAPDSAGKIKSLIAGDDKQES
jgi:type VI secretion system protein ImpA